MTRAQILAAVWLLSLLAAFGAGWTRKGDRAEVREVRTELKQSKAETKAEQAARAVEHNQANNLAEIGAKHEEERAAAPAVADAVVADLRAGNLRLRREWAGCETKLLSQAAAGAVERDALAKLREEAAGAAVRIGREADDQLRACQAVVREYEHGD